MSERRACRMAGQHRSTQRHEPNIATDDAALRAELRRISRERPRWGYRRAHRLVLDEGWELNIKRTRRVWREEGLRVPRKRRKRQRLGESTVPADRLRARAARSRVGDRLPVRSDRRRAQPQAAARRGRVHPRGARDGGHRRIDADKVVERARPDRRERGTAPGFVRCDNGPEMTANALRDWCRFSRAGSAFIEPGSPWQNPFVESFNSRVRDELLAVELFSCLAEAKVLIEDLRQDYNRRRPHRALGMMTPVAFAAGWREAHRRPRPPAPNSTAATRRLRSTPAAALPCRYLPSTSSHSRWTDERGPVRIASSSGQTAEPDVPRACASGRPRARGAGGVASAIRSESGTGHRTARWLPLRTSSRTVKAPRGDPRQTLPTRVSGRDVDVTVGFRNPWASSNVAWASRPGPASALFSRRSRCFVHPRRIASERANCRSSTEAEVKATSSDLSLARCRAGACASGCPRLRAPRPVWRPGP